MAAFTNAEYAHILYVYGLADGNARAARRLYQERFPDRRVPHVAVFGNTFRRLFEHGNLHHRELRANNQAHQVEVDEQILDAFHMDPTASTRQIARALNLTQWKVWSVLHSEGRHPYHYTPVHGLQEGDPIRRINFCRFIINSDIEDGRFLRSILWSDESKFTREGITNFHNLHYWADVNPHMKRQISFQHRFSVNVWAAVIGRVLIGPFFLPDNLNGRNYLEFLQNNLPDILDEIPLDTRNRVVFQNDGCPAHHFREVRQYLDEQFPGRWIGRNGPILWPARSPDLTPLDYYVWGRMKELVYEVEIINREHLVRRIIDASEIMKNEMQLSVTTTHMRRRSRLCIRNRGSHFEQMLK